MKTMIHRANDRGASDFGWLDSRHSFSFGSFYDPSRTHFGALRVLNDDHVAGGGGFPPHPHRDMEIISIVLEGALAHQDSAGHARTVHPGEVQFMGAGTGVVHSEFNGSQDDPVKFLQIWMMPRAKGLSPVYAQRDFRWQDAPAGKWTTVLAPEGEDDDALPIRLDARMALANFTDGQELRRAVRPGHGVYVFVLTGAVQVGDEHLAARDALGAWDTDAITLTGNGTGSVLIIETPMN